MKTVSKKKRTVNIIRPVDSTGFGTVRITVHEDNKVEITRYDLEVAPVEDGKRPIHFIKDDDFGTTYTVRLIGKQAVRCNCPANRYSDMRCRHKACTEKLLELGRLLPTPVAVTEEII